MEKRTVIIGPTRYTESEAKIVADAALKQDLPKTAWIRKAAIKESKRILCQK